MANYIIFHPEHKRDCVNVSAIAKVEDAIDYNWQGNIWVDGINNGNEDPYVFNNPWLYSYCHASQLRRNLKSKPHLKKGSKIIFVSGQHANEGYLKVDTVFYIESSLPWQKPLGLPAKYQHIDGDEKSNIWNKHFRFPFCNIHKSVTHTYESTSWIHNKEQYSFLPINKNGERVAIPLDGLPIDMQNKIRSKIRGKYPVLLKHDEIDFIIKEITILAETQVMVINTDQEFINSIVKKC